MKELWQRIVEALEERKVEDLVVLDVRQNCSFADVIIICSGKSDRQVKSLADHVIDNLGKPMGREGSSDWILLDYADVVVHILQEDERSYYDLEGMWLESKRLVG